MAMWHASIQQQTTLQYTEVCKNDFCHSYFLPFPLRHWHSPHSMTPSYSHSIFCKHHYSQCPCPFRSVCIFFQNNESWEMYILTYWDTYGIKETQPHYATAHQYVNFTCLSLEQLLEVIPWEVNRWSLLRPGESQVGRCKITTAGWTLKSPLPLGAQWLHLAQCVNGPHKCIFQVACKSVECFEQGARV